MFSECCDPTTLFSSRSVFIESLAVRAAVLSVSSALLSAETLLELCAQDFNFFIPAHHLSNLLFIYLNWTLTFLIKTRLSSCREGWWWGEVSFKSWVTVSESNAPRCNPDSSAAVCSQSSTNPKPCSPKMCIAGAPGEKKNRSCEILLSF